MTEIIPYGLRIAIVDPPAEEAATDSGLIVPAHLDLERLTVGIVVKGLSDDDIASIGTMFGVRVDSATAIEAGSLVYYTGTPFRVRDTKFISLADVVAFERP